MGLELGLVECRIIRIGGSRFILASFPDQSPQPQEMVVVSLENSLASIYQEIGEDSELEELFNSILVESIDEYLEDSEWRERPDVLENPLLWESLTEEEIKFLESEIKKDITF